MLNCDSFLQFTGASQAIKHSRPTRRPHPAVVVNYALPPLGSYLLTGTNILAVQVFNQSSSSSEPVLGVDAPLVHQWQFNGVNLPGAVGPMLVLTDLEESDSGSLAPD
jgi:hypothetical protein